MRCKIAQDGKVQFLPRNVNLEISVAGTLLNAVQASYNDKFDATSPWRWRDQGTTATESRRRPRSPKLGTPSFDARGRTGVLATSADALRKNQHPSADFVWRGYWRRWASLLLLLFFFMYEGQRHFFRNKGFIQHQPWINFKLWYNEWVVKKQAAQVVFLSLYIGFG